MTRDIENFRVVNPVFPRKLARIRPATVTCEFMQFYARVRPPRVRLVVRLVWENVRFKFPHNVRQYQKLRELTSLWYAVRVAASVRYKRASERTCVVSSFCEKLVSRSCLLFVWRLTRPRRIKSIANDFLGEVYSLFPTITVKLDYFERARSRSYAATR